MAPLPHHLSVELPHVHQVVTATFMVHGDPLCLFATPHRSFELRSLFYSFKFVSHNSNVSKLCSGKARPYVAPILPPELERHIFELAVEEYPRCARNLMLVASRTHYWVASMIYRISNQLGNTYPKVKNRNSTPGYYGTFVRHLIIGGNRNCTGISKYLAACPNLVDLALWTDLDTRLFMSHFSGMKLERLSANLSALAWDDFQGPKFAHITHLDVTKLGRTWARWKPLTQLPRLTHIAVNEVVDAGVSVKLLRGCSNLQILLVVVREADKAVWRAQNVHIDDPRFVMMRIARYVVSDWLACAAGERNMWDYAEEICSAKRHGTCDESLLKKWFDKERWQSKIKIVPGKVD